MSAGRCRVPNNHAEAPVPWLPAYKLRRESLQRKLKFDHLLHQYVASLVERAQLDDNLLLRTGINTSTNGEPFATICGASRLLMGNMSSLSTMVELPMMVIAVAALKGMPWG